MKCPDCEKNHPKKEGTSCSCGYHFVFSPDRDSGMTDGLFTALIRGASKEGTNFFTFNQLYTAYCLWALKKKGGKTFSLVVMAVIVVMWVLQALGVFRFSQGFNVAMGIIFIVFLIRFFLNFREFKPKLSHFDFQKLVQRWRSAGKPIDKLLTKPGLHTPPPEWSEPDIYDYGVERVLIVEHDLMVDELVLNGFHAQERALILSQNGYPEYLVGRAREVLGASSDIPVFYMHDAAPANEAKAGAQKASALVGGHKVIDIGLAEDDVKNIPALKRLPAREWKNRIPVDAIAFTGLSALLATSLLQGMAFSQIATSGDFGGYDILSYG